MLSDINYQDFQSTNASSMDEKLLVRFLVKEREDKDASKAEGRPIFRDVEYVEIRVPGRRDALACRPATEHDKQRFSSHYAKFKERVQEPDVGTPLTQWPRISRSLVEEMAFFHIKTVEQLASMADSDAMKFHGGLNFKRLANEWLEDASKSALIEEKEALLEKLEAQNKQISTLMSRIDAMESLQSELDDSEPTSAPTKRTRSTGKKK